MLINLRKMIYFSLFFILVFTTVIAYFTQSGIFSFLFPTIITIIVLVFLIYTVKLNFSQKYLALFLISLVFSIYCLLVYVLNPYNSEYITAQSLFFVYLLVSIVFFIYLKDFNNVLFKKNFIIIFLIIQYLVIFGQVLNYNFGLPFPVREAYKENFMLTGTFTNSNDLAATLLMFFLLFLSVEKSFKLKYSNLIVVIFLLLFFMAMSRSAIIVFFIILLFKDGFNFKLIIHLLIFGLVLYFLYYIVDYFSYIDVINRIYIRFNTIIDMITIGSTNNDGSVQIRSQSYIHFFNNLDKLYFGSGELYNYFKFSTGFENDPTLIFKNTHSYFIEISYWTGWMGLILSVIWLLLLTSLVQKKHFSIFIFTFLVASSIPSSILGNFLFIMVFIMSCLIYENKGKLR